MDNTGPAGYSNQKSKGLTVVNTRPERRNLNGSYNLELKKPLFISVKERNGLKVQTDKPAG